MSLPSQVLDLAGNHYGRLTVKEFANLGLSGAHWKCTCKCGREVVVAACKLKAGATRSCGCLQREELVRRVKKHGAAIHGERTYLYGLWQSIKRRCVHGTDKRAHRYKGRGITMYEPWLQDFAAFSAWVTTNLQERPEGYSLDRIDNDAGYAPGNLRWATAKQQQNNRANNRLIHFNGEIRTLSQWAELQGLKVTTLYQRLYAYNWPVEEALTSPPLRKNKVGG